MNRLTRDGIAEPVSRDQILRFERGQGNIHFPPVQLTTCRIGNLTRLIRTLATIRDDHTCPVPKGKALQCATITYDTAVGYTHPHPQPALEKSTSKISLLNTSIANHQQREPFPVCVHFYRRQKPRALARRNRGPHSLHYYCIRSIRSSAAVVARNPTKNCFSNTTNVNLRPLLQ